MSKSPLQIGLIGFGTIGCGVAKILQKDASLLARKCGRPLNLKTVADLNFTEKEGVDSSKFMVTTNGNDIVSDPEIDIVIELIGGVNPAKSFILTALNNKKHVITANKELVAKCGKELFNAAKANGVNFYFEASTGGGIPIINAMTSALAANRFSRIFGILNGTTNYILTRMSDEGVNYPKALKAARELGYAEADPSSDVEGHDIAYKLCILASIAFDHYFDINEIYREGISSISDRDIEIAREYGYVIKMLAIAVAHPGDQVELRVHPAMVPMDHPLASVNGSFNAVFVEGNNVDEAMFLGRGAGELPTASAIMGDAVAIARDFDNEGTSPSMDFGATTKSILPMGQIVTRYYMRFTVSDQPGVLAQLSKIFGDHQMSIKLVKQVTTDDGVAELNIMTHLVSEEKIQAAIKLIRALDSVQQMDTLLRVER